MWMSVKLKNKSGVSPGLGNVGLILLSAGFCRGNPSVVALSGAGMVAGQAQGPALQRPWFCGRSWS
jgi:hypothetical protein